MDHTETFKEKLSQREFAILAGLKKGDTVVQIAKNLGISAQTAHNDLRRLDKHGLAPKRKRGAQKGVKKGFRAEFLKRNERIAELRRDGADMQTIGDLHGLTRERVRQICKNLGAKPLVSEKAETLRQIALLHKEGCSLDESASRLGLASGTIRGYEYEMELFRLRHGSLHYKYRHDVPEAENLWKLKESGMTLAEIGKMYNCSLMTVWRRLKKAGYTK